MKKQIIEIAEYDGWKKSGTWFYKKGRWVPVNEYARNLNELHRVAIKVRSQLWDINSDDAADLIQNVVFALFQLPIRGRYTHLIKAVYDGIVYLKSQNP